MFSLNYGKYETKKLTEDRDDSYFLEPCTERLFSKLKCNLHNIKRNISAKGFFEGLGNNPKIYENE